MKKQTKQTKKQTPSTPAKKMVKVTDVQLQHVDGGRVSAAFCTTPWD